MSNPEVDEYMRKRERHKQMHGALSIGDSWFQYPLRSYGDVQRKLASRFHRDIAFFDESVPGRDAKTLPGDVLPGLTGIADYVRQEGKPFELLLVSCGGNDVIGRDFNTHLKPDSLPPALPSWKWSATVPDVALRYIRFDALGRTFDRIQSAYAALFDFRDTHCAQGTKIIGHTYADVTPSNRPYKFAFLTDGPWLWQPMQAVGLTNGQDQRRLSRWLLESFSNLLQSLTRQPDSNFVLLDTRLELPEFRGWWDNEIHPNNRGFQSLVDQRWTPAVTQALGL